MRALLLLPALLLATADPGRAQGAPTPAPQGGQSVAIGEAWRIVRPAQSSQVLARDGTPIGEIGREWRTSITLASLPP